MADVGKFWEAELDGCDLTTRYGLLLSLSLSLPTTRYSLSQLTWMDIYVSGVLFLYFLLSIIIQPASHTYTHRQGRCFHPSIHPFIKSTHAHTGKIGSNGSSNTKTLASEEKAQKEFDKQVRAKRKKGYDDE